MREWPNQQWRRPWASLGLILTVFSLFFSAAPAARAGALPWVAIGNDDIRRISSPVADLNERIRLIDAARESIDIAVYDLRPDSVATFPLLYALRRAADRGVHVRFLTSYSPQLVFDRFKSMAHYLLTPATLVPIEYLVIGGENLEAWDWSALDTIHEKIFLVDHKCLLTSGRGIGENYLHWLDSDFAIRGPLVAETEKVFDDLWRAARRQRSLVRSALIWKFYPIHAVRPYPLPETMALSSAQETELEDLAYWFETVDFDGQKGPRARVLHHDFLNQLESQDEVPKTLKTSRRMEILRDPVVDALIERLQDAREVRMTVFTLVLQPRLSAALVAAARRGCKITILTNVNSPSFTGFSKDRITISGPIWAVELPDLDDLMSAGVDVRGFQISAQTPWVYLHRKLAVIDDAVIFGSHNFNIPSTTNNDEMSYEVESRDFAQSMRTLFDDAVDTNSMVLNTASVHRQRRGLGERILDKILMPFVGIL